MPSTMKFANTLMGNTRKYKSPRIEYWAATPRRRGVWITGYHLYDVRTFNFIASTLICDDNANCPLSLHVCSLPACRSAHRSYTPYWFLLAWYYSALYPYLDLCHVPCSRMADKRLFMNRPIGLRFVWPFVFIRARQYLNDWTTKYSRDRNTVSTISLTNNHDHITLQYLFEHISRERRASAWRQPSNIDCLLRHSTI